MAEETPAVPADRESSTPREKLDGTARGRIASLIGGYSVPMTLYRRFRPRWAWERTSLLGPPTKKFVREFGLEVRHGPFDGMVYPEGAIGRANHLAAKLIGAYEPEVTQALADNAGSSDLFVDIGAGEGFFCVGLALAAGAEVQPRVVGYEQNRFERQMIMNLAEGNGVVVEVRGSVTRDSLNALLEVPALILCDVEGLEAELLDPKAISGLTRATLIVEAHDQLVPGVSELLIDRFQATHEIRRIEHHAVDPDLFPELADWDRESAEMVVFDGHGEGEGWLLLIPLDPEDPSGSGASLET